VVVSLGLDCCRVETGCDGLVVAEAGASGCLVEDLHDLGSQAARELPPAAESVLAGEPALLVRRGAKRQVCLAEKPVMRDDAVTCGQGVWQAGLHGRIYLDRAAEAQARLLPRPVRYPAGRR
jgi:hypothetical protein